MEERWATAPPQPPVKDSKLIWRRSLSSYRLGEALALGALSLPGKDLTFYGLCGAILGHRPDPKLYVDIPLPVWAEGPLPPSFPVRAAACAVEPEELNAAFGRGLNKSEVNFRAFLTVLGKLGSPKAVCGRVGSRVDYAPSFLQAGVKAFPDGDAYSAQLPFRTVSVRFVTDGDSTHHAVALASNVAKYIRELFMLSLNGRAGFVGDIPPFSGYHDKRSRVLETALLRELPKERVVRER